MPNPPTTGTTTQSGGNGPFQGMYSGFGSFFGVNPTYNTVHGDYYDPLEQSGQGMRNNIYGQLAGLWPTLNNNSARTASALQTAYGAPGWKQGQQLAQQDMSGAFLNGSPALNNAMAAMRTASGAQTANTNARIGSQYEQNGMAFGTPMQEAQQSNAAANNATANQAEAQARLQDYQQERGIQENAINNYATATTTPLNYLAQANEAYLQPMTEISQMVRGLSAGGTVAQPDTVVDKGSPSNFLGAIGNL